MEKYFYKLLERVRFFLKLAFSGQDNPALVRQYTGEDTKIAALVYIPFVCLAVLLLRKDNSEFVSFHAKHALVLLLIAIFAILLSPKFIKSLAIMAVYAVFVYGAFEASKGRKWYFPGVTELANTIDV